MRLGLFFGLALDEVNDIGMVNVENDHLGSASRLAARLDDAGKSVETFHKAEWTAGGAAAAQTFGRGTQGRKIRSRPRSPLEEHAFSLRQGQDGIERVFHRVNEARRTLRSAVAGLGKFDT